MVYRRNTRRRNSKYRRPYRRSHWRAMKKKRIRNRKAVYYYTRYADFGEVVTGAITEQTGGFNFSLSDLPNSAEFTALYDMYKINAVKIQFIPQQTVANSISSLNSASNYARFFTAIDYNDSTAPTGGVDELREYQTAKYTNLYRKHKRYIYKPKILDGSSTSRSNWVSTTSPGTNWYGIKYAVEATGNTMTYGVEVKYYLSFKNVK